MFYDKEDEGSESEGSEQVFKIIIIGESGVGKTCLAHRFATGKFQIGRASCRERV